MKGLNKILLVAAIAAPFAAQAELQSIDDAAMSGVSGQSGLVIEAGFGTGATGLYDAHTATGWTGAGIKIDAFKWEADVQAWSASGNNIDLASPANPTAGAPVTYGGFIAKDIQVAGAVDVTIDAVGDFGVLAANQAAYVTGSGAGSQLQGAGGIGITFSGSDIDFRVGDMGVYLAGVGQTSSFGSIEILGMKIDGLELVVRGNGR